MSRRVLLGDLGDITDRDRRGELLYCRKCGGEYSATRGDYWNMDPRKPFKCCGVNMLLVTRQCRLVEVKR